MISCSRWYSSDGETFYLKLSGDYPTTGLTMRHFNNEGEAVDFKLEGSGPVFSYPIGKLEPVDAWQLLSGNTVIASHGDPDEKNPDDSGMGNSLVNRGEMPKGPFDDMRAETVIYNEHANLLLTQYQEEDVDSSGYQLTTITPTFTNEVLYNVDADYELRYSSVNHYTPRQVTQSELDEILADPEELFENGNAEALEVDGNIVVPYSDGETTWTNSFVKSEVYSISEGTGRLITLVKAEPVVAGELIGKVGGSSSYNTLFEAIVGTVDKNSLTERLDFSTTVYTHEPVDNAFMTDGMIFMRED